MRFRSLTELHLYGTLQVAVDAIFFARDAPAAVAARLGWWGDSGPPFVFR